MMKFKMNCILLVDDDDVTNFVNKSVLIKSGVAENVRIVETARDALDLLMNPRSYSRINPDLIFLDLNMPGMNGWDFLSEYRKVKDSEKQHSPIVILTTSANPDDEIRALHLNEVAGFVKKPLTKEVAREIVEDLQRGKTVMSY